MNSQEIARRVMNRLQPQRHTAAELTALLFEDMRQRREVYRENGWRVHMLRPGEAKRFRAAWDATEAYLDATTDDERANRWRAIEDTQSIPAESPYWLIAMFYPFEDVCPCNYYDFLRMITRVHDGQ